MVNLSLPPKLNDILAYWRWYDDVSANGGAAESRHRLEQTIAGSIAARLCSDERYEMRWRHALRCHLGVMWEHFRYPALTRKKPARGRPSHYEHDFTFHICVLDTLIIKLLDNSRTDRRPDHWPITATLLKEFWPSRCREAWTANRVKARVNLYLRKPKTLQCIRARDIRDLVEARGEAQVRQVDLVDAVLKERRSPKAQRVQGPRVVRVVVNARRTRLPAKPS